MYCNDACAGGFSATATVYAIENAAANSLSPELNTASRMVRAATGSVTASAAAACQLSPAAKALAIARAADFAAAITDLAQVLIRLDKSGDRFAT